MAAGTCPTNISARGRRQRMATGIVMLVLTVTAAVLLVATDAPRPWRLALFLLFWISGLGLFQAHAGT